MEIGKKKTLAGSVVLASAVMLVLGAVGMTICFVEMLTSGIMGVMGAGMGFIAGSIMMGSGLMALAIVSSKAKEKE